MRIAGDDDGDDDSVLGTWAYGIEGQEGNGVPADKIRRKYVFVAAAGHVYKQTTQLVYLGGAISAERR